ncbi:hypothetical protein G9A89_005307 [Geosiphon pyriformis]|nr:hypothetical protein G9A89_005307 [Geosiphon pyriformis]
MERANSLIPASNTTKRGGLRRPNSTPLPKQTRKLSVNIQANQVYRLSHMPTRKSIAESVATLGREEWRQDEAQVLLETLFELPPPSFKPRPSGKKHVVEWENTKMMVWRLKKKIAMWRGMI